MKDKDDKWTEELGLKPDEIMDADRFLDACMTEFPRCVRYSYREQQRLLPNILTVGAVIEAIPLDEKWRPGAARWCSTPQRSSPSAIPYLATKYVYEKYVKETAGLAMLNPGFDVAEGKDWTRDHQRHGSRHGRFGVFEKVVRSCTW